jgi:tRNA G18 (ribose-2'-O)-methylase SpoU
MNFRNETRRDRYNKKKNVSSKLPIEVCTVNFKEEVNVAFVLRSAACFGASAVNVIGSVPKRKTLATRSGTLQDYVPINQFSNPHEFLQYCKQNAIKIVSAELDTEAVSIHQYDFTDDLGSYKKICIVVGHEQLGIPVEILNNSTKIYIPMPGVGFCLNTSVAASIFLYEAVKQISSNVLNKKTDAA